ncbi:MAG: M56 family metallopeptidase [Solirubrobacteraceae bacterium]
MTKARGVAWLYAALAVTAVATAVAAVLVSFGRIDFSPGGVDRLVAACRTWGLPGGGPASVTVLVLGAVGVAVLGLTAASAARQMLATRRFVARLTVVGPLDDHREVRVIADAAPLAFCVGSLRPRVHISTGAVKLLTGPELRAVLAHEAHHVRCRDPLRLLVIRSLAEGLFVLPALGRLSKRYAELAELAADEAAEQLPRGSQALASALLTFDAHPDPAVVGIAPERVDRLLGARAGSELPVLLIAGAALTLLVTWIVTVRLSQVTHGAMPLPDLLAQGCMLVMTAVLSTTGVGGVLVTRRLVRRT